MDNVIDEVLIKARKSERANYIPTDRSRFSTTEPTSKIKNYGDKDLNDDLCTITFTN